MITFRTGYWYVQAFWSKYRKLVVFGVALGVALVWLFPRIMVWVPQWKKTEYVGRVGLYSWNDLPSDILAKVSVGLTALNAEGEPVPVLAQRWSVEEDGRVFRFLLKQNLRWQDGQPFRSDDIPYEFSDVQVVRTDNEIVFRLNQPYAPFATTVTQPLFRQRAIKRLGIFPTTEIIGLGEYRVLALRTTATYVRELVLENNSTRIIYRFYPSEQEAITAFRHGHVDRLEDITDISSLSEKELAQIDMKEVPNLHQFVGIFFNTADPNLTREMRQALNYALHKPEANDARLRAFSPISPVSWAYNDTNDISSFSFDQERALELFERANPQQALQITLDAALSLLPEAQRVADDWMRFGELAQSRCRQSQGSAKNADGAVPQEADPCARFGIQVSVRVARSLEVEQALLIGREVPPDPDQYSWWHSTQPTNTTRYQNPRVDKLLEDARRETDQGKRKLLYFELQKYLVEDVPAIFLYHVQEYTLQRTGWW